MTLLLSFDTSSPQVSVAIHDGQRVLAERVSAQTMKHGEQLAPLIDEVTKAAGAVPVDLTAIAVGAGPGPFTGLRVGLVTARTLGLSLEIPVYAACSLDVLAYEAVETSVVRVPFMVATDARRKEVYAAHYDEEGHRLDGPMVVYPADIATTQPVVGEGALLYAQSFSYPVGPSRPSAGWLAEAIVDEAVELLDPEPLYLRRPDAVEPGATVHGAVAR